MKRTHPIISICIPTYNRVNYLEDALNSIIPQVDSSIEVIISDNASTDSTSTIVQRFQKLCPYIKYCRNNENLGTDKNILISIQRAQGEYAFLFSDDDILLEGSLPYIKSLIDKYENLSLIYLNFYGFKKDWRNKDYIHFKAKNDMIFANPDKFLNFVSFRLGFMSSLILYRKNCLNVPDLDKYVGSNFIQLYIALAVLLSKKPVLWVARYCVAQRTGRSGGFNFVRVFGYEFQRILWIYQAKGYSWLTIYKVVNKNLLRFARIMFFSHCLGTNLRTKENMLLLFKTHWTYPLFWIVVVPIFLIPVPCAKVFYKIAHILKYSK